MFARATPTRARVSLHNSPGPRPERRPISRRNPRELEASPLLSSLARPFAKLMSYRQRAWRVGVVAQLATGSGGRRARLNDAARWCPLDSYLMTQAESRAARNPAVLLVPNALGRELNSANSRPSNLGLWGPPGAATVASVRCGPSVARAESERERVTNSGRPLLAVWPMGSAGGDHYASEAFTQTPADCCCCVSLGSVCSSSIMLLNFTRN